MGCCQSRSDRKDDKKHRRDKRHHYRHHQRKRSTEHTPFQNGAPVLGQQGLQPDTQLGQQLLAPPCQEAFIKRRMSSGFGKGWQDASQRGVDPLRLLAAECCASGPFCLRFCLSPATTALLVVQGRKRSICPAGMTSAWQKVCVLCRPSAGGSTLPTQACISTHVLSPG